MNIDLPIKNFPAQQSIFACKTPYKIAVKGRRFGLTKGAANDFIESALNSTFKKGLWIDTVNSNIERYVERYFLPKLHKLPEDLWDWRKQLKILVIKDSYIDFRSADRPENIEGFGYDKFFINEAGIVLKNEYLWDNAIRPMLWDYSDVVEGVIGGTPKGKGKFYELAERGKDPNQTRYQYFHFTTFDNPYLNKEVIEEDIKDLPERVARQEIYAEFIDDSGAVFRNVSDIATAIPHKPEPGHLYVCGVDLAKVQDFTVIAIYDRTTNKQVFQDRFNTLEWPFQKEKIRTIAKHYNNALILLDATGIGDPIADDLTRSGLAIEPIKFTNEQKKQLIEKLSLWIEQKRLRLINIEETIREFNNFTYDITSTGKVRYEAPVGFHDDIVFAHALAVWSLQPIVITESDEPKTLIQQHMRSLMNPEKVTKQDEQQWIEWGEI